MVRKDHADLGANGGSHDFLHALMVAQYGALLVNYEKISEQVWIAGIIHNTDRLFPLKKAVKKRLNVYLSHPELEKEFSLIEKEIIISAVLEHDGANKPDDCLVKIALQDADRLANIGPNMIVRSGQHYHKLPAYDPRYILEIDSEATYKNPRTVLHDIKCALEWENDPRFGLRLPKAKELAKKWFERLKEFIAGFAEQLEETKLLPYPFPEDLEKFYCSEQ